MENKIFRAGFLQFKPSFGQLEKNLKKILTKLQGVTADLIVLPELPFTGYFFKDKKEVKRFAHNINDSFITTELTNLCKKNKCFMVTGFAEKENNKVYNSALLIGPKGVIDTYRKIHLFNLEKYWFDPGNIQLRINKINGINIGMMVCWDWIYPEVTRKLAVMGADIICHPSNLVLPYCQYTMVSRSIENGVFTITANRTGVDKREHGNLKFTGKSQMTDPKGKFLYRAKANQSELYITEIDVQLARNKKITSTNDLMNDRRPEFY